MIKDTAPLSMAEASEYIKKKKDAEIDVAGFIKKFKGISPKTAKEIRKNIQALNLIKVNPKHISKMIDLLPENKQDLNKIFSDVSLNEDETNKILEEIKKSR